jgi:hypothetical protein
LEHIDGHIELDVAEGKLRKGDIPEARLAPLEKILETETLFLTPADKLMALGQALRRRGHEMVLRQRGEYSFLLFYPGKLAEEYPEDEEAPEEMGEIP